MGITAARGLWPSFRTTRQGEAASLDREDVDEMRSANATLAHSFYAVAGAIPGCALRPSPARVCVQSQWGYTGPGTFDWRPLRAGRESGTVRPGSGRHRPRQPWCCSRIYRDGSQYEEEERRGRSAMDLLRGVRNVEIRVKPPSRRTLMHLKVNIVDGALLREGSANWSPAGLKEQDNSLIFRSDREAIVNFKHDFEAPWNRPGNISVQ